MAHNAMSRSEKRIGDIALDNDCTFRAVGTNEYVLTISGETSVPRLLGDIEVSEYHVMSIGWNTKEITVTESSLNNN